MNESDVVYSRKPATESGSNIIGIIFYSVALGIATSSLGEAGRPFRKFAESSMEVVLKVLRWFMWFTPIGVASLIAVSIIGVEDIARRFQQLGMYILSVTVGILFQELVFIPILYFVCYFKNPFRFLLDVFPAWSIAFASGSEAVVIPEMIECCERRPESVDKRVSRFVVPFSVTLSASGSALYITASAIFIGQVNDINMDAGTVIVIGVLAAVSGMALPPMPSASIVAVIIILETMNFPVEDVALLLAVEWYMDRIRTGSNTINDTFCALFTYRWCRDSLPPMRDVNDDDIEISYARPNAKEHMGCDDMKSENREMENI